MKKLKDLTNAGEIKVSELMTLKGRALSDLENNPADCTTISCCNSSCASQQDATCGTQICVQNANSPVCVQNTYS